MKSVSKQCFLSFQASQTANSASPVGLQDLPSLHHQHIGLAALNRLFGARLFAGYQQRCGECALEGCPQRLQRARAA